jgi:hypothetical protein
VLTRPQLAGSPASAAYRAITDEGAFAMAREMLADILVKAASQ